MTDKQQELFQKMLEGKIKPWVETVKPIFFVPHCDRYFSIIIPSNKSWDDYAKAWEAYKQVPLVKAME